MTKNLPTARALARVQLTESTKQEAAATIRIDPTGGYDVAHLTINPELVTDEQAREGYRIRAAVAAALAPFERYNRAITRKYGTYEGEQRIFDEARAQALEDVEQLVHLTPTAGQLPDTSAAAVAAAPVDRALPDDFPLVAELRAADLRSVGALRDATEEQLRGVPGVGPKRYEEIQAALAVLD